MANAVQQNLGYNVLSKSSLRNDYNVEAFTQSQIAYTLLKKKKKKDAKASRDYFPPRLYKKNQKNNNSNLENITVTYQFGKQCFQFGI